MQLTSEQQLILDNCEGNIYIAAGPGSGKSTMLSEICKKLLVNPTNKILLVTFTNAAARSIIKKCNGLDQSRIIGGTFHSIAYRALKSTGRQINICDEHKKRLIIKCVFKCKKDKDRFEEIYERISYGKSLFPTPESEYIKVYNDELRKYSLLDFDDLILETCKYMRDIKQGLLKNISHILVDELQDTSGPQFEMLNKIAGGYRVADKSDEANSAIPIIGVADDDQCIYQWRGARPENVTDFIRLRRATIFNMGTNFRSNATIVRHSSELIKHNKNRIPKVLRSYTDREGAIIVYECVNPLDEIDYIVSKCKQNKDKHIAILYRNRTFKYHLEYKLRQAGLKYRVNDFLDITDRSAVRVMVSCLKISSGSFDYFDIEQAAKALKGIGVATLKIIRNIPSDRFLTELAKLSDDPKLKSRLFTINGLQEQYRKLLNQPLNRLVLEVENFFTQSFDYQKQMKDLLIDLTRLYKVNSLDINELANELGLDNKEENNDEGATIELSTIHGFKGLEDEVVMIPFVQMFLEPIPGRVIDEEAERRLFYVGITRAKEKLYISYSGRYPKFLREMKI